MTTFDLVNTGILMGIIHVLTGPDHLSALATLSGTNIKKGTRGDAFLLGIRWGVGHSFGLLLVGGLLIAMEESSGEWIGMDPFLSIIFEGFVGVFMLALGTYGLFKAEQNNRDSVLSMTHPHEHKDDDDADQMFEISDDIAAQMEDVLDTDSRCSGAGLDYSSYDDISACLSTEDYLNDFMESTVTGGPSDMSFVTVPMKQQQQQLAAANAGLARPAPGTISHAPPLPQAPARPPRTVNKKRRASVVSELPTALSLVSKHTGNSIATNGTSFYDKYFARLCGQHGNKLFSFTPGMMALVAGVVHGVAGPGGVLGVIPAIQLRDPWLAMIYLGTFCLTSTCVMGGFAAFYGSLSEWLAGGGVGKHSKGRGGGNRVFMVEVGSALLSLSVGVIWLVLLALGGLEDVFP